MAAATHVEIESFIGKFLYLTSCGYDADLNFTTTKGIVEVNFKSNLGCFNSLPRHTKPSKLRRRQRRRENRINSRNASFTDTGASDTNIASVVVQPEDDDDHLDVLHQQVSEMCEVAVTTSNSSQIHAAVQTLIEMQASACQTDHIQLESPIYSQDQKATTTVQFTSFPPCVEQCGYCDKEFANWNEFLEYMKVYNLMCNNCLDYFPEKPWFSSSHLVMVDV